MPIEASEQPSAGGSGAGAAGAPGAAVGGLAVTVDAALHAGLAGGALWGLIDGVVAASHAGTGGPLTLLGCLAAATFVHALLAAAALLVTTPLWHAALGRRPAAVRFRWLLGLVLGVALFLDLYWWTRPLVLWGVPATDPRRLAAGAGMALGGLLGGVLLARLLAGALRSRGARLATLLLVASGAVYLLVTRPAVSERGEINDLNRDMPNVLLFVVDALRQDVLGCYGNERIKTPVIDGLASRGVVFENAFVQAPYTWTSFGSILTGKYPRRHGLLKMAPGVRMPENITLASHLKEQAGYTGATLMTGTLTNGSGLLRGFDAYYEAMVGHPLVQTDRPWSVFRSELVLARVWTKLQQRFDPAPVATQAVNWLRENGRRRFVAMVHYYSTHTPYDPVKKYREMYVDPAYDGPIKAFYSGYREKIERGEYEPTPADVAQIQNLYYGGVTWADDMIGQVLDELERQGVLDDTLVIVTSDHGEELNDHGLWEHNWMYQTNLRIPLVMSWPKGLAQGVRVGALVETVDIVPTVCDLLGIPAPHDASLEAEAGIVDGRSLLPLIAGEVESVKRFVFAENGLYLSIQTSDWKLVVPEEALEPDGWEAMLAGEAEPAQLYHLATDPEEQAGSVLELHPEQAEALVAELRAWNARLPQGREIMVTSERDREDLELLRRLQELGYADGVGHGMEGDE